MHGKKILLLSAVIAFIMSVGVLCVSMISGWERYHELKTKISAIQSQPQNDEEIQNLLDKISKLEEKLEQMNKDFKIDSGKIEESLKKYKDDAISQIYSLDKTQSGETLLGAGEINDFAQAIEQITYSFDGLKNEAELNAMVEDYKNKVSAVVIAAQELSRAKVLGKENLQKLIKKRDELKIEIAAFKDNGSLKQDNYDEFIARADGVFSEEIFSQSKTCDEVNSLYEQTNTKLAELKTEVEDFVEAELTKRLDAVKKTAIEKVENEIFERRQGRPDLVGELLQIRKDYIDKINLAQNEEEIAQLYSEFTYEVYALCK